MTTDQRVEFGWRVPDFPSDEVRGRALREAVRQVRQCAIKVSGRSGEPNALPLFLAILKRLLGWRWNGGTDGVKQVPGRKTDVRDAAWIAGLLRHGLLQASNIPGRDQRELRDLTRYRMSLVDERTTMVDRVQKVLEDANLKSP